MPNLLFLVVHDDIVLYHAHSLIELFRLRSHFNPPEDAQVYRYVATMKYSDAYFKWNSDRLGWELGFGPGFGLTSFSALEAGHKLILRMKEMKDK